MFRCLLLSVAVITLCGCGTSVDEPAAEKLCATNSYIECDSARPVHAKSAVASRAVGASDNFIAPAGRQMAFTANLSLSVREVRPAIMQSRELALKLGGYVKRQDDNSITLAIPTEKADTALNDLAKLGVVQSLRIEGVDVTDQITDLAVRLENLEKSRQRLLALLNKAGEVDEMVKVEKEITRVTTELERLQAQRKNLTNRVDFVTMTVRFHQVEATPTVKTYAPVAWVNQLGDNLLFLNENINNSGEALIFKLALPAGFVQSGSESAISANNCIIKLDSYLNAITSTGWFCNDYATLDFYVPMLEKTLAEKFTAKVEKSLRQIDGKDAVVLTVRPKIGDTDYTFKVAVAINCDKVAVITARGKSADFAAALPANAWDKLLDSVRF